MHYEVTLKKLFESVLKIGVNVKEAMLSANKALESKDRELASKVVAGDTKINEAEAGLEEDFIAFIATHSPVAHDLRKILGALKIIGHLERIGDHAAHVCNAFLKPGNDIPEDYLELIHEMFAQVVKMLDDVLTAFMNDNADLARSVAEYDNRVDELFSRILSKLLDEPKEKFENRIVTLILTNARYLERSGDHITHICEWIVFSSEGRRMELN
jgi:phosphate transport system protein